MTPYVPTDSEIANLRLALRICAPTGFAATNDVILLRPSDLPATCQECGLITEGGASCACDFHQDAAA